MNELIRMLIYCFFMLVGVGLFFLSTQTPNDFARAVLMLCGSIAVFLSFDFPLALQLFKIEKPPIVHNVLPKIAFLTVNPIKIGAVKEIKKEEDITIPEFLRNEI